MTEPPAVTYPAEWEADVLLRDGHPVHLRPITPADGDSLRAFHASLSDRTVYFRFFSAKPALTDADVVYFTTVDHVNRVALVALDAGVIVGVGRFDALGDGRAEVAFVIRDDVQGLGLGSVLLEHLAAAGRELGITRFIAEVLPENTRMLATFREAGFEVTQRREEDVLAVGFDIEPTETSVAVMEAREHRAEARSVERLLHPARVAVVGASRNPGGLGHALLQNLVGSGFTGEVVAVHPEVDQIAGVRCVRTLTDVDGVIDLALVAVPAERVAEVIEDAEKAGVLGLVVISGGFGDAGSRGLQSQADLAALVHRTGMRLVGPNALGLMNTDPAVSLNASLVPTLPPRGRIGFFSQSGALSGAILDRLRRRGLGISTFVSAGNRADISGNDVLQYWEEDPDTDLILLHLETIGNARKFARIVHRLSETKPVVMVRSGGAGQRHPLGHAVRSTSLSQAAVDEILGDCGLVVVESIDHLLDVALLASRQALPAGPGLAIVGNSDALAVMAVNACERTVMSVVGEPVTFARQESPEAYEQAISAAFADPGVGSVLAIFVPPIEHPSADAIRASLRRAAKSGGDAAKPVVALMVGTDPSTGPGDVPTFEDIEDALQAMSALTRYALWRQSPSAERSVPPVIAAVGDRLPMGLVADGAAMSLAGELGIRVTQCPHTDGDDPGLRVRLREDPLFGPVVTVGVDDPVAELLDDRAYRLAPVTPAGARLMIESVAALPAAFASSKDGWHRHADALAELASAVSAAVAHRPEVAEVDVRGLRPNDAEGGLCATGLTVTIAPEPITPEPAARRM